MEKTERELFGGAIKITLPDIFKDISDFRPVADHQEIFATEDTDESFIIEILEMVEEESPAKALEHHFRQVAFVNESENDCTIIGCRSLTDLEMPNPSLEHLILKYILQGRQNVAKFRSTSKHYVYMTMVMVRLIEYETDMLITFNGPLDENFKHTPMFMEAIASFKVIDWELFQ